MKKQLKLALSAGVTFGIVTIFLFLIGFTSVSGDLLADLFGNKNAAPFLGLTPQTINMLIFLSLIGLWAGSYGSRKSKGQTDDPWAPALIGGVIAGLVHGILVGLLALLVGTLNLNQVPINMYLASVLPASIKMFLLGGSPVQGCDLPYCSIHADRFPGWIVKPRRWTRQLESPGWSKLEERLGRIQSKAFHQTDARLPCHPLCYLWCPPRTGFSGAVGGRPVLELHHRYRLHLCSARLGAEYCGRLGRPARLGICGFLCHWVLYDGPADRPRTATSHVEFLDRVTDRGCTSRLYRAFARCSGIALARRLSGHRHSGLR